MTNNKALDPQDDQPVAGPEQRPNYKAVYLKSVFLLAAVIAFGTGFYRWQINPVMGMIDFGFSGIAGALLYYLKHHPERVELISSIALSLAFILFCAIYLFAPYQTTRVSLFYLLSAAAFFLKGLRGGLYWLLFIMLTIAAAPFIFAINTGYSGIDILTTCLYLGVLFVIFWNYEILQRDQFQRAQEQRAQLQMEAQLRLALENERGLLQSILNNAPLGIWMVDTRGKVQFVNQDFCKATGIAEARFLAADHYTEVLPRAVAESCMQSDTACFEQKSPHLSTEWLPFADGQQHLLEITKVRLLDQDGTVRGLIGLAVDVTERTEHEKQLERIAHYDALTGAPNRVLLADRMVQALARTKREQGMMAVCYLDLDGFKPVNDRFGHDAGDQVLVEVTRRIRETIREDDTVARLGGDEFVVVLVGLQVPEECVGSLHRLLDAISQPIVLQGNPLHISASIGVSLYPEDDQDADTLLRHADQAMYSAKQAGKNRYHLFDAGSDQRARSHHALLQQIRHGLARGEFELYYQPKVDLVQRRMVGAEALIRWHHPQRGLLPPDEFLRVTENTELEIELGNWVIASACAQLHQWHQEGNAIEISINISAYHLQSADFINTLRDEMRRCCPPSGRRCLQVELLESVVMEDIARVGEIIKTCREFGVGFALDDFGSGYSPLTCLSTLDLDTLKIDQSFVRAMLDDKGAYAIVEGIIALAHAFERTVVAEGAEHPAQLQALQQLGCTVVQGYGIAQAMPASALLAWSARAWPVMRG
ncbi:putative bifunctional diguanylate cyclase/phosphodiesterase [Ferrigenium sp. UT5]|uniref:putative bifunctional diguanylate cyclase/phosphodiesterase n=1 Tax=Ferrigenium sp. UT5 TaxID=3242105 RepID=UPI0035539817